MATVNFDVQFAENQYNVQFEESSMELEAQFEPNGGGGGGGAVSSVNGQTGAVVLDAGDLGYDDEETYTSGTVGKEISNLKGGLTELQGDFDDLFVLQTGTNLFNKNGEILTNKGVQIVDASSTQEYIGDIIAASGVSVQFIPFGGAGSYSLLYPGNYYGRTRIRLCLYDSEKTYLRYVEGTFDSDQSISAPAHFTISSADAANVAYIGYCYRTFLEDEAMFVKSSIYPSEYIPYVDPYYVINGEVAASNVIGLEQAITTGTQNLSNSVSLLQSKVSGNINAEDVTFIDSVDGSANLFNKNGDILSNKAIAVNTGAIENNSGTSVQYIPFAGAGTYYCLYPQNYYGQYNVKFCLYDSTKTYLRTVVGSKTISENAPHPAYVTISAENAVNVEYIGYCFKSDTIDTAMFVKADSYPETYIPFSEPYLELDDEIKVSHASIPKADLNPLYAQAVVFDGDSIGASPETSGGYAKIIGDANSMDYHNVAVSGGTITAGTYSGSSARHWLCRYIDTIHANYATLDYLILEGGTNDADLLTNDQIGTLDSANYTTFDDETFIGALESLFYKAINYYPTAKIGFIVAHKMGDWANEGYDSGDSPSNHRRRKFFEIAMQVCEKWGIPYIDLWNGSPLCPKLPCYYDSSMTSAQNEAAGHAYYDGQHLTQVGYDIISPKIEAWMKTL